MGDDFGKMMASFMPKKPSTNKPDVVEEKPLEKRRGDRNSLRLPITEVAKIEQHQRTVSCIAIDGSGARFVTGGYDYNVGYYDFGGMDQSMQPFRYIEPDGSYKIKALRFSNCSKWVLCASSSNTAVLLDRDGSKVRTYTDGDPYLRDLKNTNGHVAALTTCHWHPTNADQFLTASEDGTVRIWNIGYRKRQDYVMVVKSRKAGTARSAVTHAMYNQDASMIITASADGSMKLYSGNGPWTFPNSEIIEAHRPGCEITYMSMDTRTHTSVVSRATDGTVKLWDIRNWTKPIAVADGLANFCSETACLFSPENEVVVTGTSAKKGEEWGKLVFLDSSTLETIHVIEEHSKSSVVGLCWPSTINQIITGNGDGSSTILYDRELSVKGALLCQTASKARTTPSVVTDNPVGRIITPHALPLFRDSEGQSLKRARIKARKDPIKSHLPTLPIDGPGQGGRLGSGITQAIMAERLPSASTRDEDPREALLKYAKAAEENPMFITPAYKDTQPKPVLDPHLLEKEAEAERKKHNSEK